MHKLLRMVWLVAGLLTLPLPGLALPGADKDAPKSNATQYRLVDDDERGEHQRRYYRDYDRRYYRDYDRPYWGYREYGPAPYYWRHHRPYRYWDWDRDWD